MTFLDDHGTGSLSEGECFAQLIAYVRKAQEAAAMMGHLKKAQGDEHIGQGFLAISEMLKLTAHNVTKLVTKGRH